MLDLAVPLADTLLPTIIWNFHMQFKWRHARRWGAFPKRQFFGNRPDNTQQNGEHSCFCATIWAQISCRVVRCLVWLRMGAVVGPFWPANIRFVDVFITQKLRSKSATHKNCHVWSCTRLSKSSQTCFARQSTRLWSLKCTNNVSFRVWHLTFMNNSNVDWTWNLVKRFWSIFNQHAEFCYLGNPM